jgi:hypothetical protein
MARMTLVAVVVGATLCSCGVIAWTARSARPAGVAMTPTAAASAARRASRPTPPHRRPDAGDRWAPVHSAVGPRFRVESNFSNQAMVLAALDAAEAAWPETRLVL